MDKRAAKKLFLDYVVKVGMMTNEERQKRIDEYRPPGCLSNKEYRQQVATKRAYFKWYMGEGGSITKALWNGDIVDCNIKFPLVDDSDEWIL